MRRFLPTALVCSTLALSFGGVNAGPAAAQQPPRAIRRDIPMTNAIRRAHAAGTRDSTGRPGRNHWQLRTDYTIRVRLDPATQRITGSETITLVNNSPDTLRAISLRLPLNHFLFENPRAASWVPSENTDGMPVSRLMVDGKPATMARPRSTITSVTLPTPIPPRASTSIEIDWSAKLPGGPGVGHRMTQRWADTLFQPTQLFPRVAMYDDLRGWDSEMYLGPSEFYNEFGNYDVRITVPGGWIVSGTGVLQNPGEVLTPTARQRLAQAMTTDELTMIVGPDEVGPGAATAAGRELTWHLKAEGVNDFAWATAKKFVWKSLRANIPGKGFVPIHMLHLPGRAPQYASAGWISRHALEFYSKLWFAYPFPQLTLQDGPSAGMEYPMVINSNQGAADHETGHQWWPMTVSNNETWYGWMDEGFDQYMNILSDADSAGKPPVLDRLGASYGRSAGSEAEPPMMWNANFAGPSYGFTTYGKTPLMLSMLGGIVGDSAVQRAHREFATAWMWKHPSPWDWMFFMNRALGQDLGWFWNAWLFGTESVDGSVSGMRSDGARTFVNVRQAGQMPSPVVLEVKLAASGPAIRPMRNAVMKDATTAIVTWPVDVWFGGARSFEAVLDFGGRAVESVMLDPNGRFPDRDASDNRWPRAGSR
jgi:hypothetical protein